MFFAASHTVILLIFAVAIFFTGITVFDLRNTSTTYSTRLFTFGYFSLGAWILWALQYALLADLLPFFPSRFSFDTVLSLALIQNTFWASAVFSLRFQRLSRKSLTFPLLGIFSIVLWLLAIKVKILTSEQFIQYIAPVDIVSTAAIFLSFAIWIVQLRHSKIYAAVFLIDGVTQWKWTWLWLSSFSTDPLVQFGFPLWRIALLIAWIKLISEMRQRTRPTEEKLAPPPDSNSAPPLDQEPASGVKPIAIPSLPVLPDLLAPLKVMISSTVDDLSEEREVVDLAIRELKLARFRAETFGSVPHSPKVICALLAEQCDIFVLIVGERSGYIMSDGVSVVEFEYTVARRQNPEKILVYVKEGVDREPRLMEFVRRLEDFDEGYFRSLFKTPDDLRPMVQGDIARWLAYQRKQIKQN